MARDNERMYNILHFNNNEISINFKTKDMNTEIAEQSFSKLNKVNQKFNSNFNVSIFPSLLYCLTLI